MYSSFKMSWLSFFPIFILKYLYYFLYGLFNDALSISYFIASSGMMINE